jgi:hypothetical protein
LSLLLVGVLWLLSIGPANALSYNLQVGAVGDQESIGSLGVRAEIRMRIYTVAAPDLDDSFWIASNLVNGGGIQFGYELPAAGTYCTSGQVEPGTAFACTSGSLALDGSQPIWFWQYSSNTKVSLYHFGLGTTGLATLNGTWYSFAITPNFQGEWAFLLDGHEVANASYPTAESRSGAVSVAEKVTSSTSPGQLGPVEFRNLAYLRQDGWHNVTALYAIVNCGVNPNCIPIPYGVSLVGPNHIIAGSSVPQPEDGELLWNSTAQPTETRYSNSITSQGSVFSPRPVVLFVGLGIAAIVALLAVEFVVLPRRRHMRRRR